MPSGTVQERYSTTVYHPSFCLGVPHWSSFQSQSTPTLFAEVLARWIYFCLEFSGVGVRNQNLSKKCTSMRWHLHLRSFLKHPVYGAFGCCVFNTTSRLPLTSACLSLPNQTLHSVFLLSKIWFAPCRVNKS